MPRHFFSWRSLWDLYQALRQSIHDLCPPDAPAPAVLVLPLIGLVFRRETGHSVFVNDDSARKVMCVGGYGSAVKGNAVCVVSVWLMPLDHHHP